MALNPIWTEPVELDPVTNPILTTDVVNEQVFQNLLSLKSATNDFQLIQQSKVITTLPTTSGHYTIGYNLEKTWQYTNSKDNLILFINYPIIDGLPSDHKSYKSRMYYKQGSKETDIISSFTGIASINNTNFTRETLPFNAKTNNFGRILQRIHDIVKLVINIPLGITTISIQIQVETNSSNESEVKRLFKIFMDGITMYGINV